MKEYFKPRLADIINIIFGIVIGLSATWSKRILFPFIFGLTGLIDYYIASKTYKNIDRNKFMSWRKDNIDMGLSNYKMYLFAYIETTGVTLLFSLITGFIHSLIKKL